MGTAAGRRTAVMMCTMPLEASTSAVVTCALLMKTPLALML